MELLLCVNMDNASTSGANALLAELTDFDMQLEALQRLQPLDVEDSPFGEYVMDCPVCKSAVRYYFVNLNEKFKMCENKKCEYPFGYEELQFVKHNDLFGSDEELDCATLLTSRTQGSVISTAAWSDIEKLKGFDNEDQSDILICPQYDMAQEDKLQELIRQKEGDLQTKKNLQDIKKLNVVLKKTCDDDQADDDGRIKNKKWIKHLNSFQTQSKVTLLKNEEMEVIQKDSANKLTFGITTHNNSITINLALPSTSVAPDGGGDDNMAIP